MRKLCLSGFRLVALFCSLVAPPFAVFDSLNQDKRQQVATFVANLAIFQQRVSAMPKAPQRLRGKYLKFDETSDCPPFKKLLKRDDQLSSKDTSTTWTTSQ